MIPPYNVIGRRTGQTPASVSQRVRCFLSGYSRSSSTLFGEEHGCRRHLRGPRNRTSGWTLGGGSRFAPGDSALIPSASLVMYTSVRNFSGRTFIVHGSIRNGLQLMRPHLETKIIPLLLTVSTWEFQGRNIFSLKSHTSIQFIPCAVVVQRRCREPANRPAMNEWSDCRKHFPRTEIEAKSPITAPV